MAELLFNNDYQQYIHRHIVEMSKRELNYLPMITDYPLMQIMTSTYQRNPKPTNIGSDDYNKQLAIMIIKESLTYLNSLLQNGQIRPNFNGRNGGQVQQNQPQPQSQFQTQGHGQIQGQGQPGYANYQEMDTATLLAQKMNERSG